MTQLVVGVASAAVGFAVGGPTGAQIGWALGTALAAPTQKTQGPRLTDLKVTGAEYGQPIPWIAGHPRISGQVWWASDRREVASTSQVGKGGGVENTTYTYEVDLLIGLCDREITYVSRIWSNGKLVYTALADADDESITSSNVADLWGRLTVYTGAADQLPDPTYEAAVGVGNAPAYRGRGAVFMESLQLGSGGQIPNFTFEVCVDGVITYVNKGLLCQFDELDVDGNFKSTLGPNFLKAALNSLDTSDYKFGPGSAVVGGVAEVHTPTSPTIVMDTTGVSWRLEFWHKPASEGGTIMRTNGVQTIELSLSTAFLGSAFSVSWNHGGGRIGTNPQRPANNVWNHIAIQYRRSNPRKLELFSGGEYIDQFPGAAPTDNPFAGNGITRVRFEDADGKFDSVLLRYFDEAEEGLLYPTGTTYTIPTEPFEPPPYAYYLVDPAEATLQATVEELCARAGMPAGTFDATALAAITKPVRALAVGQVTAVRAVLEQLAGAYFFEAYATDKLYFVPRGGSVALTISADDMGAGIDQAADEALPVNVASDEQIPAQIALSYWNESADYNTATEHSDRLLSGVKDTQTASLPMAFTSSEAKGIVDAMLADAYAQRISGDVALPIQYQRLVPTDVVTLVAPNATEYRARLVRRNDQGVMVSFEWVLDDPSALVSAGITSSDYTPSLVVSLPGLTDIELLDIPILRDADDSPGIYVAAKPFTSIWPGYQLLSSVDGGTEYGTVGTGLSRAVFGVTTTALSSYTGGNVFDEIGAVTVDVGDGELASSTRDAMLDTDANAMLVGDEVIQFRTATLVSAGVYTLTGLLRGRRGTEWAMTGHASGERAVLLRPAGLLRVAYDAARIGLETLYKGVTLGKAVSTATAQSITDAGVGLKPFAPADLRVSVSVGGVRTVTWSRRTRLSYRWLSSLDLPLGEAAELYSVDWLDELGAVISTSSAATASATAPSGAYGATVYQVSSVVGRGIGATIEWEPVPEGVVYEQQRAREVTIGNRAILYFFDWATVMYTAAGPYGKYVGGWTGPTGTGYSSGGAIKMVLTRYGAGLSTTTVDVDLGLVSDHTAPYSHDQALFIQAWVTTYNSTRPDAEKIWFVDFFGDDGAGGNAASVLPASDSDYIHTIGRFSSYVTRPPGYLDDYLVSAPFALILPNGDAAIESARPGSPGGTPRALAWQMSTVYNDGADYPAGGYAYTFDTFGAADSSPASAYPEYVPALATAVPQIVLISYTLNVVEGATYVASLGALDFQYTTLPGDTLADVRSSLAALIDAEADYTATTDATSIIVTGLAGVSFEYSANVLLP